ncbi:MAG: hypothetical protein IPK81_12220 [Rhodospirillales bacterium]|nr:MAG: hypothetical protein IPK81_12220 [Rhodospirillales bacterium]
MDIPMLVLAPVAIFLIALALAADAPRRVADGLARVRSRRMASARGR